MREGLLRVLAGGGEDVRSVEIWAGYQVRRLLCCAPRARQLRRDSRAERSQLTFHRCVVLLARSLAGEVEHSFTSFHDVTAVDVDGSAVSMSQFKGKTLLVCNVACK